MTTTAHGAAQRIIEEVTTWPGIALEEDAEYRHVAFVVGSREIGHLHGDHALHIAFTKQLGTELRAQGRLTDHPVFPGKQAIGARRIEGEHDVREVIELLRLNYDRIVERYGMPANAQ